MFRGQPATGRWAAIWSASWRRGLLALHRLLRLRNLDLTRNRPAPKQLAVRAAVVVGNGLARLLATACAVEWRWLRAHPAGTAQYLVFAKPFPRSPAG